MKKYLVSILAVGLFSNIVLADQCVVVDEAQAKAFSQLVKVGDYVGSHCEPCGDELTELGGPTFELVKSLSIEPFNNIDGFYTIKMNGQNIDLAYTYVQTTKGEFRMIAINAAYFVGCPTRDVTDRFIIGD